MKKTKSGSEFILYAVYHDLAIEERSREVFSAISKIPGITVILNSIGTLPNECEREQTLIYSPRKPKIFGMLRLFEFWNLTKKLLKKYDPKAVIVHDDAVLIRYIKKHYPNTKIIYDQSELEIDMKVTNLKTLFLKLCNFYGKKAVKLCDLFISANNERAEISRDYYRFECKCIIFDNMHKIEEHDIGEEFSDKYKHIFSTDKKVIVYGGGISEERGTFDLIDAVKDNDKLSLVVAGSAWNNLQKFNDKLKNENIINAEYVGYVSRREWAYILSNSAASVVFYDPDISMNYKFCASGKGYESLFMGVPIICSENPPLVSLCTKYKCGVCGSNIGEAARKLFENYDSYKKNAEMFGSLVDYYSRIPNLTESIKKEICN